MIRDIPKISIESRPRHPVDGSSPARKSEAEQVDRVAGLAGGGRGEEGEGRPETAQRRQGRGHPVEGGEDEISFTNASKHYQPLSREAQIPNDVLIRFMVCN